MLKRASQLTAFILLALIGSGCHPIGSEVKKATLPPDTADNHLPKVNTLTPPSTEQPTPEFDLTRYAFPKSIDTDKRYMFYLHGRIIENGLPAIDPEYGEYEYGAILEKLAANGFVVISEQRPKDADSLLYAHRTADQVRELLKAGVPPGNISVVGASKGAYITILTSNILKNMEINYVIMGICNSEVMEDLKTSQIFLYGNLLSIYDSKDIYASSCEDFFSISRSAGLNRYDEIVLHIGTGHGILYKPLDEWIDPVIEWAGQPLP